jgi:hypothetical protein
VAQLASDPYLSVHSLPQEDYHETDDASAREIYPILVPKSTVCTIQPPRRRQLMHQSWTGKHKHIERLRCTVCAREFSEREGTLMARSKLPETTMAQLLKCQRWGVCDAGTADICNVDLKTVYRFQHVAAQRTEAHHRQRVQHVE